MLQRHATPGSLSVVLPHGVVEVRSRSEPAVIAFAVGGVFVIVAVIVELFRFFHESAVRFFFGVVALIVVVHNQFPNQ